jgi:hypothetical protein
MLRCLVLPIGWKKASTSSIKMNLAMQVEQLLERQGWLPVLVLALLQPMPVKMLPLLLMIGMRFLLPPGHHSPLLVPHLLICLRKMNWNQALQMTSRVVGDQGSLFSRHPNLVPGQRGNCQPLWRLPQYRFLQHSPTYHLLLHL